MNLDFTEEGHIYRVDGVIYPSVTQALSDWIYIDLAGGWYVNVISGQKVPAHIWEAAQDRGTACHKILEYLLTGQGVDKSLLDMELLGHTTAIEKWMSDYSPEVILCEHRGFNEKEKYCGTLDFFVNCKKIKHPVLGDEKSGMEGKVGPQTSGYEPIARKETGYKGIINRYCLQTGPNGDYTFEPCGSSTDWQYFKMKLSIYKIERGGF